MNKSVIRLVALSVGLVASNAFLTAQSDSPTDRRSIGQELDVWISKTEADLIPAADAMPEEKYGFRPAAGQFQGARTFAEQVKHLAAANYMLASAVLGEQPPHQERGESAPDTVHSKSQIMEYLRGSFTDLHRAAAAIHVENESIILHSKDDRTRPGLIVDALAHSWNHYGQMVEYLRMNGIVPPASQ